MRVTDQHSHTTVKSFQLALEIYYSKAKCNQNDICATFEYKFSIKDLVDSNNGDADISTYFSVL